MSVTLPDVPVDPAEYQSWLTPAEAIAARPDDWSEAAAIRWIANRLAADLIHAVASSHGRKGDLAIREIARIPPEGWKGWACMADMSLWTTGDVVLDRRNSHRDPGREYAFYGVRFDPAGFAGFELTAPVSAPSAAQQAPGAPTTPLSTSDYARASRAIAAGWETSITETQAWELAKRLFPGNRVGRDAFLARYRVDRGDKKPGKVPSRG